MISKNSEAKLHVYILDFGSAKDFGTTKNMTKEVGTPSFIAPEVSSLNPQYGPAVDIYSFGKTSICLLTRKTTITPKDDMLFLFDNKTEVRDIISKCVKKEPEKRPTSTVIFNNMVGDIYSILKRGASVFLNTGHYIFITVFN